MAYTIEGRDVDAVKLRERSGAAGPDIEVRALGRVENLVWIKGNTFYKEALEDWERQTKLVGERLDRREKRSQELNNRIYNLVGFFSVFQRVILTAVTQLTQPAQASSTTPGCPPRPLCKKVWFPIVLSGRAAIAAVVGIGLKFSDLYRTDQLMLTDKLEQRETIKIEKSLRQKGQRVFFQGYK